MAVGKPKSWAAAVRAAAAIALGASQPKAAEAAGVSERTVNNWVGSKWWPEAMAAAKDSVLEELETVSLGTVMREAKKDAKVAMWALERLDRESFGNVSRVELDAAGKVAALAEEKLEELSALDLEKAFREKFG